MTDSRMTIDAIFAYKIDKDAGQLQLYDRSPLRDETRWERPLVTVPLIEDKPYTRARHFEVKNALERAVDKLYDHTAQTGPLRVQAQDIVTNNEVYFTWRSRAQEKEK